MAAQNGVPERHPTQVVFELESLGECLKSLYGATENESMSDLLVRTIVRIYCSEQSLYCQRFCPALAAMLNFANGQQEKEIDEKENIRRRESRADKTKDSAASEDLEEIGEKSGFSEKVCSPKSRFEKNRCQKSSDHSQESGKDERTTKRQKNFRCQYPHEPECKPSTEPIGIFG
jgi:hypothetical protein